MSKEGKLHQKHYYAIGLSCRSRKGETQRTKGPLGEPFNVINIEQLG